MSRIAAGTRIGPYEVVSFLAAGGMGEVYRGHDGRLGRAVAIKVLPEAMFDNAEAVLRFEREARAAAAVSHPNLISIHDVGRSGDLHYLVMDLLEGETLRARLDSGALPWTKAVEIGLAICAGIAAVHAKGFIHRDLKPENIFLTREGWVKLLDFGLVLPRLPFGDGDQTMRALTEKGLVVGTISYMSPEQLRGEAVDARTDLFSLGCVLYEMLAGQPLFEQPSRAEIVAAILASGAVRLPPPVPPSLTAVVNRCLERTRERRFDSAEELAGALRAVSEGSAPVVAAGPPSIAVLPFTNVGGDAENDYFSDGLAEEILSALTRVPGLKVTARTSAFAFRGKTEDIRRIGEALGVRTILEGSVRRAGNRVRVTAQLIDAGSGYHLWSARYDAAMDDVFGVQDEIAAAIVETLHLRLVSPQRAQVPHTSSVDAWHAYLKSRYHFGKLTPERLELSRTYAEQAIALDPSFAEPHACLAECYVQTAIYGIRSSDEMLTAARAEALQAVALDEAEPSAHMTLARIAAEYDRDWSEALRRCRIALACDRISPAVRALCAMYVLWPLRRFDEIAAANRPALASDPLSPMPRLVRALALAASGAHGQAIDEMRSLLELHDRFWPGHLALGQIYTLVDDTPAAIPALEKALEIWPANTSAIGLLAGHLVRAGESARGERLLERAHLPELARLRPLVDGGYHYVLGDYERSADGMTAMLDQHYPVGAFYATWLLLSDAFSRSAGGQRVRSRMNLDSVQ